MRLALLTKEYMSAYMEIVTQDYTEYYYFIYDVLLQRERTKVWLAIEGREIVGLMLIYNDCMVQLRGSPDTVGFLLSSLSLENVDVQAPADCEDMLLAKFPVYKTKENLTLMRLVKGEENLKIMEEPERLSLENAEDIAQLMRDSYPLMWREMTGEKVKVLTNAKGAVQFGLRRDGRLVALGAGFLTPHMSIVTWLATLEGFRRQGFCSSLLSVLVREGLKVADFMAIHVLDENSAARRIYEAVGFRAYRSFVLLRV